MENMTLTNAFALLLFVLVLNVLFSERVRNAAKAVKKAIEQGLLFKLCFVFMATSITIVVGCKWLELFVFTQDSSTKSLTATIVDRDDYDPQPPTIATATPEEDKMSQVNEAVDAMSGHQDPASVTPASSSSWQFATTELTTCVTSDVEEKSSKEEQEEPEVIPWTLPGTDERYDIEAYFDDETETFHFNDYLMWALDVNFVSKEVGGDHCITSYWIPVGDYEIEIDLIDNLIRVHEYGDGGYDRQVILGVKITDPLGDGDTAYYFLDDYSVAPRELIILFDEVYASIPKSKSVSTTCTVNPTSTSTSTPSPVPTKTPVESSMEQVYAPIGK